MLSKNRARGGAAFWPRDALRVLAVLAGLAVLLHARPARAQVSARDGYAPDGSYRVQVEVTPYAWLPATSTNFTLGPRGGIIGSAGSGVPTAAQLANSLHGAFMAYGLLRYGPWSGELDVDWVSASQGKTATGPLGNTLHLSTSATLVRVAPGFGYQVLSGGVAGMPATLDARAGFAWFHWSAAIGSLEDPLGGVSDGGSFVQPWLGMRASVYPAPLWRVELSALGQGFGVGGGSWGWGASLLVSYSVTKWLDLTGGFRALSSSRVDNNAGPFGRGRRSIDITAYGPVVGVGLRF